MIHSVRPKNVGENEAQRVPAIGISFPCIEGSPTVKVRVNKVWLKQMRDAYEDNPDDEEDYDTPTSAMG